MIQKYNIMLTNRAKDDIANIAEYITYTLKQPDISIRYIKGIKESIACLKLFPYSFTVLNYSNSIYQNIRFIPYKDYYIFYQIAESTKTVIVVRIGHKKKNWLSIL